MSSSASSSTTATFRGLRRYTAPVRRCSTCGCAMVVAELTPAPERALGRLGGPQAPARGLPIWQCGVCGRQEPRVE